MTEIPKDKISCKICKYRGESPISGTCEGCNYFSKFEIDYDKETAFSVVYLECKADK